MFLRFFSFFELRQPQSKKKKKGMVGNMCRDQLRRFLVMFLVCSLVPFYFLKWCPRCQSKNPKKLISEKSADRRTAMPRSDDFSEISVFSGFWD